ncbi:MAG: hypothetical protein KF895_10510 [Parvibaculum sp.]|nr:hypothetical protein [Cryobacterium sp.]MBX3505899.1 hypothetical protein [Parvibaculum sp.]HNP15016.1 hypothetical protein [Terrimesophilobacter sp.]
MRARLAASAALVALLAVGTTGCTFITDQATARMYDASDGISATVGDIQIVNALLVTADGTAANLLINVVNHSDYGIQVNVQYENADKAKVNDSVFVNAGSVKSLGGTDAAKIVLSGIDAPAGSLFPVFIQYGDVTGKQMWLPVLAPNGEYSSFAPEETAAP